jgi:hypothetical protein
VNAPVPEYESVEAFVEYLLDEDRTSFTFEEACEVASAIGHSVPNVVIHELLDWGLTMIPREPAKLVRGYLTNSNDRWYGPGSSPTHGGSGWEQISGFAGQKG